MDDSREVLERLRSLGVTIVGPSVEEEGS